jgi:hypothetical protein
LGVQEKPDQQGEPDAKRRHCLFMGNTPATNNVYWTAFPRPDMQATTARLKIAICSETLLVTRLLLLGRSLVVTPLAHSANHRALWPHQSPRPCPHRRR